MGEVAGRGARDRGDMTTRVQQLTIPTRPTALRLGAGQRFLRAAALAATVPYLTLKAAWLSGSHLGIPAGSALLEPGPFLMVANAVTLAMDATVILLVLLLTRPWGMRVPAPVLTLPVFAATGLLTPIVLGYPAQLLVKAVGLGAGRRPGPPGSPSSTRGCSPSSTAVSSSRGSP